MSGLINNSLVRRFLLPGFIFLGIFLIISYGCGGGGGGGGSSILLPPHATTGTITGQVLSDGSIVITSILSGNLEPDPSLRESNGIGNAEIWIENSPEIRTLSGTSGVFALENVPFGTPRVVARVETALQIFLVRSNPITISEVNPTGNAGELRVLEAINRVQGILKDRNNNPIPNAVLSLWGITFRTDADGHFISPPLPPQETSGEIKIVTAPGMQNKTITTPFQTGYIPELEIVLTPTGEAQNAPVAFLTASATTIAPSQQVRLYAAVQDPDDKNLNNYTIDWSVTEGLLATSTNRWTADWTAPDRQVTATATIVITDITGLKGVARMPLKVGTGTQPGNQRPVVSNVVTSGSSGNIAVTYKLVDADNDVASISVLYSIDGGQNFNATTNLIGSTTGVIPGENRSITWQSAADISDEQASVTVKIVPADQGGTGTSAQSPVFAINNRSINSPPVVSGVTTAGNSGNILLTYTLADNENDACSISVAFSVDGGTTFNNTSSLIGSTTGILPGSNLVITWQSAANINNEQTNVVVRITPQDQASAGTSAVSSAFAINNTSANAPPVISNVAAAGNAGDILLTYDLADNENDACSLAVYYSIDGGNSFSLTQNLTGSTTNIIPGSARTITWNSAANVPGSQANVSVRLVPNDGQNTGTAGLSNTFSINNNGLPTVSNVLTSGNSGSIQLTFDLADPENDPCSIEVYVSTDGGTNYQQTTALVGSLSDVLPGTGKALSWDSRTDLPSNQSNVRIKIVANDGSASGISGESAVFSVNNNTLPVVSNVTASGNIGNFLLTYNIADSENDACSITVDYSLDGGTTFVPTGNLTGTTTGIAPGLSKTIVWNSAADITGNKSNVKVRITPNDGTGIGTAGISPAFSVSNNNLPAITAVTTSGTSGSIQMTYTLSDPNSDLCSVTVFYSTDGGSNYQQTTNLAGTTTGLTSGTNKTLTWNSATDFGSNSSNVKIKIIPNDGSGNGVPGESPVFTVNNNTPPVVANVTTTGSGGSILINYNLTDANNHSCTISVFYSTDGGTIYTQTTNLIGSTTAITPGAGKTITWNSSADVSGNQSNVKVRVRPNDGFSDGTAGESPVFTVNNNDLPVVSNVTTSGSSGNITVTYNLTDANNDPCSINLLYSIDNGLNYTATTNFAGTSTGIMPGSGKTVTWNSTMDIPANEANVKIKIVANDGSADGTPGESTAFPVNNNQIPVVTAVTVSGSSGDLIVSYTLTDGNNDPCSIKVFYSTDGGVNYLQTSNLIGSTTGVLPGVNRNITWNSASDIPSNQNNVRVKVLPNDSHVNGTEGQSAIFSVNNNNLPVVSSVTTSGASGNITVTYNLTDANGDNCAINVYFSIDNGTNYTQTNNLTGTTANIPPGTGKTITWNSALDVTGNQTQVRVKIIPRDLSGSGSAGESAAFSITNNNAPVISAVSASGNSGSILLTYTLADAESDACSVAVAYSINGGTTYTTTTKVSGTVAGVLPGSGRTLTWLSDQDLPSDQASVRIKLTPNDGFSTGTAGESQIFTLSNSNQPPTVSTVTTTGTTGDITIGYTLADPNSDPCSIEVYYSTNGGSSYVKTTNITGKTTDLTPGTGQSILWNSALDIGGSLGNIRVRVVPIDRGGAGTGGDSATFSINNNGRPVVNSVTTSGGRGNITITYNLSDPESNPCSLYVYYSLDNGVNYTRTTQLTGQTSGIAPGNGKTIVWNSSANINGSFAEVKVRVTATDGTGFGTPGTSSAFAIANDGMPSVLRIVNTGSSGQIVLAYDLLDPNNDLCSIEVYYSTDNGFNYTKTTNLMSGLVQDIIPGSGKTITWNSTADLMGSYPGTKIKIIPSDPAGAGIPGESMAFLLRNNRLPTISSVVTTGNSGDIGVTYTLSDEDSDACNVAIEYSTNNGVNWFPTYNITGSLSNVSPGAGRTFTWRSADDFLSTHGQVRLRLTPNDGVGNGTPGMSSSFAVANNSLPSISNVSTSGNSGAVTVNFNLSDAENNPCSITLHYSLNAGVSYTQSTFVSGQTTNVIPGTGHTIVWESSNNVTTNVADVRIRLVPNDGTGNGTAGVSPAFALNNDTNAAPAITAISRSGTSGNITFTYTLSDANNDACTINLYYSTDGGSTYYLSRDISGAISGVLPGAGRTLVWNSVADVNSTVTGVLVKLVPQDARSEGTSMTTAAFNVSNNSLPSVSSVVVTADSGPIPVSYTLADSNNDACNMTVYFSIDGGLTFTQTTNVSGTLIGVSPGSNRSLIWNSGADITGNQNGVRIKLVPADAFATGTSGETSSFAVNNNQLPIVSSVTIGGASGDITVTYNLADGNTHACSIEVYYSIDGGTSWLVTSDLTGTTTGIAPGNGKTIVWKSAANINRNQSNVRVKIVPADPFGTGTGANSSSFTVLNNQAPVISAITPTGNSGSVVVSYTLADGNDNTCSVLFYYSTNGGGSYVLSNNITGVTSNIAPGSSKLLTWNSTADINTDNTTVRVRIIANDGATNGAPGDSATFSVLNNRAPVISNVTTSGNTGDINITYNIADDNGDSMSIALAYSTDNWATSNVIDAANITGATSGITTGNSRSVTWNSAADIVGDSPNVKVRITPNDGLVNGTVGDSASFAVGNNNLPTVSNVVAAGSSGNITLTYNIADANNDNCSIQVYYSTDGGASYFEATNLTGATTGIVPGNGKTITWNSVSNIPGSAAQVKVKILPNDGTGTGSPGESAAFGITNNSLPAINNVTTAVTGTDVTINYQLADNESDNCSIEVHYSIDGGTTFTRTTALTGAQSNIAVGARSIVWNSLSDFRSNSGNIRVRVIPNDGKGVGTAGTSGLFALSNNSLPTVAITNVAGTTGAITVTYNLTDVDQNACSIELYYSINGGFTYTRTLNLTGQTSNVSSAIGRTITWNSGDDFTGKSGAVYVRVVANDGFGNGDAGVNGPFSVNNNTVPVVSSLVTTGSSGNIGLTFNLTDANNHSCDLSVDYSIDGGTSWASATGITGSLVSVTPGSSKTLTWDSRQNFTSNQGSVKVRITPRDPYEIGTSGPSGVFTVNNNRLPVINNVVANGSSGDISFSYSLADLDNDNCGISVAYSVNGGAFTATANISGSISSVPPGSGITLVWRSATDIKYNSSNVRLRLTPNDGTANGTAGESVVFSLSNNELPVTSNVSASVVGSNATFNFTLSDATVGDLCSITVLYSTNNGSTWLNATNVSGHIADVPAGIGKSIVWNTLNDLPGKHPSVRVRLLPNDGDGNGTPGEPTPVTINNNRLPAINSAVVTGSAGDISVTYNLTDEDNDACNIAVAYSLNGGAFTAIIPANLTGTITGVTPGQGRTLVWKSASDVSYSNNVRLKLTPSDPNGAGTAAESVVFVVNNVNELPVISNLAASVSGKSTVIDFDLADGNSDLCAIAVTYSTDGGANWQNATNLTGAISNVLPGTARRITWSTSSDLPGLNSNVKVRLIANDTKGNGDPAISASFVVDNSPPAVSNIRVTKQTDGTHRILYDLGYPSNETSCTVAIWYYNGSNWAQTNDQLPTTGVLPGTDKILNWSSSSDLPGPTVYTVKLEVRPVDGAITGTSTQSNEFLVNSAPVISVTNRESEDPRGNTTQFSGNIKLIFNINSSFPAGTGSYTAQIEYTTNNGVLWQAITADRPLEGFKSGTNEVFWETYRNFSGNSTANQTRLRIKCTDGALWSNQAYCPASFTLQNSHLPNNTAQKFVKVTSSGYYFNAALTSDGKVYVWGQNPTGYYIGNSTVHTTPTMISHVDWQNVADVECSYMGVISLGNDKTIRCIGYPNYYEFGNNAVGNYAPPGVSPTGLTGVVTAISCSYGHTLALHENGTVWAFGTNGYYQLGDGTVTQRTTPVQVSGLSDVKAIAAGGYTTVGFSLALKTDGTVWSWGYNGQGQLGVGDNTTRFVPQQIPPASFGGVGVKAIAAGANHSLFLLENGKVYYCGHDGSAARGNIPIEVVIGLSPLEDIQKIFAGQSANSQGNSFAINSKGEVFGWGYNASYGQLGLNNTNNQTTPVKIPGISRISSVAVAKMTPWITYVSNAPTGNSGIWNAGYGSSYYQMTSSNGSYIYLYHP